MGAGGPPDSQTALLQCGLRQYLCPEEEFGTQTCCHIGERCQARSLHNVDVDAVAVWAAGAKLLQAAATSGP